MKERREADRARSRPSAGLRASAEFLVPCALTIRAHEVCGRGRAVDRRAGCATPGTCRTGSPALLLPDDFLLDFGIGLVLVGSHAPIRSKDRGREESRLTYCCAVQSFGGTFKTETVKLARFTRTYRTQPCGPVQPSRVTSSITACWRFSRSFESAKCSTRSDPSGVTIRSSYPPVAICCASQRR